VAARHPAGEEQAVLEETTKYRLGSGQTTPTGARHPFDRDPEKAWVIG